MPKYKFEVLNRDEIVCAEPPVVLNDARTAWPKIRNFAKRVAAPAVGYEFARPQAGRSLIGAVAALDSPRIDRAR